MNKICARCGAESRDEARICVGCGGSNFKLTSKLRRPPLVVPCPTCKRLNRAGTPVCVKCGTALTGASAMTAPAPLPAAAPRSAEPDVERQVGEAPELPDWVVEPTTPPRSGIWIATTLVAIVVVALAAWFAVGSGPSELDADEDAPAQAEPAAVEPPTMPPAVASQGVATDDAPVAARPAPTLLGAASSVASSAAAQERERREREKRERDARARAVVDLQRAAEQQRVEREAEAARQQAAVQPAPVATAAPAPVVARAAPPKSVSEICAGRNLISEQLCLSSECRNPTHASDPVCVARKELEDNANRRVEH
jgi:hypothetical protein